MSDDDDDKVGYGRPPKATRFQKGRSGNPKGRPKKPKLDPDVSAYEASANELMWVVINGKRQRMTRRDYYPYWLWQQALAGNKAALAELDYLEQHRIGQRPDESVITGTLVMPWPPEIQAKFDALRASKKDQTDDG